METKAVKPVSSPLDEANFISRWTVYWMSALLAKGNVKKLDENDMYPLPKNYDADKLGLQFEQKWTGSVLGTMRALHYWEAVNIIPSFLILSVAATFSPFFVQGFIRVLSNRAPLLGLTNGWVLIALLIISGIVQAFTINYGFLLSTMLATKVRAQMANAIFRKSVRLSSASRASLNAGDVLNLMSQDTERLFFAGLLINTLWWSCLMLVIILIVLITQIGIAGLASVLFAVCLLPLTAKIAEWTGVWKRRMLKHTDERVSFSSEVFQGIATIKMQGWEDQVGEKVFDYRRKEMVFGHKVHRLLAVNAFQVFAVPAIMTATCFGVLIGTRPQGLDVSTVYTVLAFINTLLLPLDLIPRAAGTFAQAMVSVRRIEAFMKLKEVPSTYLHHEPCAEGLALEMENCSFFWMRRKDQEPKHHAKMKLKRLQSLRASFRGFQDKQPKKNLVAAQSEMEKVTVLSSINLQVKMGELCVIVGRVGSGKTSLLAGILGEIEREPGGIVKQAPNFKFVAYAPQEPWIQNATVKNNILFSLSKRQEHAQKKDGAVDAIYERVIDCVEMEVDLSTLPKRDETEIGSRGINLSGGQKARVGLGRALYHALSSSPQSCLIVLDDPFAALDPKVAASVWTKTVEGCLKADTRVVALSSNLHLASRADRIVVMEEGKIVGIGSPEEVLNDAKFAWLFDARNATNKEDEELEEVTQHHSVVFDEREVITLPFDEMNDSGISSSSSPNDSNRKTTKQIVPTSTESFRENIITKEDAPITSPASMVLVNTTPESVAASAQLLTNNNNNNNGKLYRVEERAEGAVNRRTYYKWLAAGAFCKGQAILSGLTVFALFLITQAFKVFSDLWIGLWVRSGAASLVYGLVPYYVAIFFLLVFAMSRALVFVSVASEASTKLHDDLFKVLLKAPVNLFFDITPSGRILNRLSNDLDHIDTRLPETALQLLHSMALICGALALAIYASPWICLAVIPLIFVFRSLAKRLSNTQRQVKRYDGTTRSPLFSHFSETLAGLHSIRAFNVCDEFVAENKTLINKNTVFFLCFWTSARWFALRVDCLAVMVQFVLCALIYSTERQDVAVAGLAVTYSLLLTTTVQACTRHAVETENAMVACERIVELIETVPQERDTGDRDFLMTKGQVEFVNVSARYRPNLDLVLRNVSFKVEGGKRVGVCGRTGAGKSSLGSLIFGMVEIENDNGMILFDGKNQKDIALSQLRSQLAVIPQNPVLFSGTIRFAIDPWNSAKSDAEIWKVLEQVELSNFVKMLGGLDGRVEESGASFSVGERQLLCVSRALFRKNVKVVLVDEGTASVDAHSDVIVQKAINEGFVGATKFTIAHRLHTIIHSDLIIVLDKGNLMEFNSPQELLKMNDGIFKSLWDQENQINKDN